MNSDAVKRYRLRRAKRLQSRFDADEDEEGSGGRHGNTRIPYGLCQREGISIQSGWTPRDAWEALEGKGYNVQESYKSLRKTGSTGKSGSSRSYWKGHSSAAAKKIRAIEDKRRSDPVESLSIVDEDGKVVLEAGNGSKDEVVFNPPAGLLRNKTLTHNHPSGTTFSENDIHAAVNQGLREIRACFCAGEKEDGYRATVDADGEFSLRRDYELDNPNPRAVDFVMDYHSAVQRFKREGPDTLYYQNSDKWGNKEFLRDLNVMIDEFRHKWLSENAKNYGWTYSLRKGKKKA